MGAKPIGIVAFFRKLILYNMKSDSKLVMDDFFLNIYLLNSVFLLKMCTR